MSSGTDGCINACLSLYDLKDAKRNVSEVIVPALSFIATSNSVRAAGLVPKFVDVKRDTLNIDETKIEEAINENTVAIRLFIQWVVWRRWTLFVRSPSATA
jgi:dTDP-4-amino-4,6-dideoxygalactose transaminase